MRVSKDPYHASSIWALDEDFLITSPIPSQRLNEAPSLNPEGDDQILTLHVHATAVAVILVLRDERKLRRLVGHINVKNLQITLLIATEWSAIW